MTCRGSCLSINDIDSTVIQTQNTSKNYYKFGTDIVPLKGRQFLLNAVNIPDEFHFSGEQLLPTRNQGQCGGCWAFALTSSLHNRIAIYTNNQTRVALSPQQLIDCVSGNEQGGCEGATLEDPIINIESTNFQIVPETSYPYLGADGTCQDVKSDYSVTIAKHYVLTSPIDNIGDSTHLQNIENIKQNIYQHGPIVFGMSVYPSFMKYDGVSVYEPEPDESSLGGHAILGVGWGVTSKGVPFWVCRNSWGPSWPPKHLEYYGPGVFFMKMGINNCKMEEQAIGSIPKVTGENVDTSLIPTPDEIEHQGIYNPNVHPKPKPIPKPTPKSSGQWYRILILIAGIIAIVVVNVYYKIDMAINIVLLVLFAFLTFSIQYNPLDKSIYIK